MEPLFEIPESLEALDEDGLRSFIAAAVETIERIAENPQEFAAGREDLMSELTEAVVSVEAARAELNSREEAAEEPEVEFDADELAALAARARAEDMTEEETVEETVEEPVEAAVEPEPEPETEVAEEETEEAVTAAAPAEEPKPAAKRQPRPARSRAAAPPVAEEQPVVPILAAANSRHVTAGQEYTDMNQIGEAMIEARGRFGIIPEGTHEEIPVARATWSDLYPNDRYLGRDEAVNSDKIDAVVAAGTIKANFDQRKKSGGSLTASGGLCAPVTPYYQLQMLSVADRPVRAALPSFNADRGGIKHARPATLATVVGGSAITVVTAANDALGGTSATKGCQVIACPNFVEADVEIIAHCLQFGNLTSRTFPELLAQWNSLTLAAHARVAETELLNTISANSTHVTASAMGLGASATLPSQILTAAQGMRSRHRMRTDVVLRVMLPYWVLDLLVSDVYRSQFQRFDMDGERFVALLRDGNVEPTFYIDSASGDSQVYGSQSAAALLPFPSTVVWYLFPEGTHLFLDGGVLELGLVRDSVLNKTNDFQLFGESFEGLATVGIESLKITSTTCDSGTVTLPHATTCPVSYA